jgi:hypothetical protein
MLWLPNVGYQSATFCTKELLACVQKFFFVLLQTPRVPSLQMAQMAFLTLNNGIKFRTSMIDLCRPKSCDANQQKVFLTNIIFVDSQI